MATGFNSKAQAACILESLRTTLTPLGMTTVTRGHLRKLPDPPATVLLGPRIHLGALGLGLNEARFDWIVVLYRSMDDAERRADLIDDWADAAMTALFDTACSCTVFDTMGAEDGPHRVDADESLYATLQRMGLNVDATVLTFSTRRNIEVP